MFWNLFKPRAKTYKVIVVSKTISEYVKTTDDICNVLHKYKAKNVRTCVNLMNVKTRYTMFDGKRHALLEVTCTKRQIRKIQKIKDVIAIGVGV